MDTKALRQKILDLAIRGKLVPQDPNDEPASALLERIRVEKQQMVKDGKLKPKDIKNDTVIFKADDNLHYEKFQDGTVKCIEDEIPFELPEGWEWARLKDLLNVCSSKRVLQSDWKNEGIPFYRAREIVKLSENHFIDNELFISEEHYLELKKNYGVPQSGDLMVSSVGTIGKVYIVKPEDLFYYKDASVLCFENKNKLLVSQFAKILLESSFVQSQMRDNSKGTTVDTITISAATNYLCIVPPKNEQLRIVDAAQRALVKVIQIQSNKDVLQATITNAKSKILDLAIRGKLVPQDPNDEPASVLLERIRAEKEGLIKQGKIKRDKKDSVIFKGDDNSYYEKVGNKLNCIDEEISFKLPEGWAFIRLKTAWELISGRDLSPSDYNDKNDGIPYITGASNFKNGHVSLVRWTPVPQVITQKGDLLLTCKGTIGEIAYNNFGKAHIARQIMAIRNNYSLNVDFLALCIEYSMTKIKQAAKGLIPGISREDILNLLIPIPPTKEQEKICDKLKVTFSAIKHIEKAS
ncbi:MAG TPA: restriction endonuclease subunit S [Ruminococcus sp.]|nr:restriction endonuclease subunit S [Ruminococcus sp.]HCL88274.1 restriction endonuclease subunit S [Ruminococcus sp.]